MTRYDLLSDPRRLRIRALIALFALSAGVLVTHYSKENHAQSRVPLVGVRAADHLGVAAGWQPAPVARASRSRPPYPIPRSVPASSAASAAKGGDHEGIGFQRWRRSAAAHAVVQCESIRDHSYSHRYGTYRGYWQIGPNEWRDWGGLKYASSPELATRHQQDLVAYTGWLGRGWEPWTCAYIIGLI